MFDQRRQCRKEARAVCAVDRPMIAAERQMQHRDDSDRTGVIDRLWTRGTHREDCALRRIDDRVELLDPDTDRGC